MTPYSILIGSGWVILASCIAYFAIKSDKTHARNGDWRIPEAHLLFLAFVGGWPGAKIAQRRHRHKTRKQPFRTVLNMIPILWVLLGVLALSPGARAIMIDALQL